MNLTDIARYLGVSRPTAYKIVRSVGFPAPVRTDGAPRWDSDAVMAWIAASRLDDGAMLVGGVVIVHA